MTFGRGALYSVRTSPFPPVTLMTRTGRESDKPARPAAWLSSSALALRMRGDPSVGHLEPLIGRLSRLSGELNRARNQLTRVGAM